MLCCLGGATIKGTRSVGAGGLGGPALGRAIGAFGDGSDGVTTWNVDQTLTRDMHLAGGSSVALGVNIHTNGFKVFCSGDFTDNGANWDADGVDGANGAAQVGGNGGAATNQGTLPRGIAGTNGANASAGGGAGGAAPAGPVAANGEGGVGGAGGAGGSGNGGVNAGSAGATVGAVTVDRRPALNPETWQKLIAAANTNLISGQGGGGGGAGGGNGVGQLAGAGGGGGGGAGILYLAMARFIAAAAVVFRARGGKGGNGQNADGTNSGGGGGGGPGGGGTIHGVFGAIVNPGNITATVPSGNVGTHGNKTGTGVNGTDGSPGAAGFIRSFNLTAGTVTTGAIA